MWYGWAFVRSSRRGELRGEAKETRDNSRSVHGDATLLILRRLGVSLILGSIGDCSRRGITGLCGRFPLGRFCAVTENAELSASVSWTSMRPRVSGEKASTPSGIRRLVILLVSALTACNRCLAPSVFLLDKDPGEGDNAVGRRDEAMGIGREVSRGEAMVCRPWYGYGDAVMFRVWGTVLRSYGSLGVLGCPRRVCAV